MDRALASMLVEEASPSTNPSVYWDEWSFLSPSRVKCECRTRLAASRQSDAMRPLPLAPRPGLTRPQRPASLDVSGQTPGLQICTRLVYNRWFGAAPSLLRQVKGKY